MSTAVRELGSLCEALPAAKQAEVADFARFLLERGSDERWESIVAESATMAGLAKGARNVALGSRQL